MPERVLRLGIDPGPAVRGSRQFDRAADSSIAAALGLNKAVLRASAGIAAVGAAAVGATVALGRFAQAGGRQLTVQTAFTRRVGNSETALVQLRAATSGLVSDMELMTQANQALTLGSARTVDEFAELAATAQTLGRALGLDVAFALNSLNIGIARQSRLVLDNVGLIVSAEVANRKYAAALGVATDELTDAEKQEAFRVEAMEQARRKMEDLGETSLNAGDAFTQFNVELENTVGHYARMIAQSDGVANFFEDLTRVVKQLRGEYEELNAQRVLFLETGQTPLTMDEAIDRTLRTEGRGAGGATQFFPGNRGSFAADLADDFDKARERMEELGESSTELDKLIQGVHDFENEMALLEFRLERIGELLPRTLSDFEIQTGLRPIERRTIGTGDFGRGFGGVDPLGMGVDRSQAATDAFAEQVMETAENLVPLSKGADEAASGLEGLADDLAGGVMGRFDAFAANLGANLASSGISFAMQNGMVPALQTALTGTGYVSAVEANTDALRDMSAVLLTQAFEELPEKFQELERFQDLSAQGQFRARMDIARRRLDATDAEPGDEFDAIRDVLAGGLSGPLAGQVAGLTTENVDEFLQRVLDQIEAGTLDPEDLGSVSLNQFLDLLAEMENLGDATEAAADEFDALTKSIQALNSPSGLNLALLGYRAGLDGGGRRGYPGEGERDPTRPRRRGGGPQGPLDGDTPRRRTDGGGSDRETDGVGGRRETVVTINVNGARDPVLVANEVVRVFEREAARGGPMTLDTSTRLRR